MKWSVWPESEAGFTLIEMLVASVIFAFVVAAFVATYTNARLLVVSEGARRQALILAQSRVEEIKLNAFVTLEGIVGNDEQMDISIADVDFSRTVSAGYVDDVDYTTDVAGPSDALKLTITVSDNDAELDFPDVVLQTVVAFHG